MSSGFFHFFVRKTRCFMALLLNGISGYRYEVPTIVLVVATAMKSMISAAMPPIIAAVLPNKLPIPMPRSINIRINFIPYPSSILGCAKLESAITAIHRIV